jgi:hypothetical protein
MKVCIVVGPSNSHGKRIQNAISLINACQKHYRLECIIDAKLARTGRLLNPHAICSTIESAAQENYSILLIEDPLEDNWFSHEYRSSAVITIADWESVYAPPSLKAYIIYQIAQALIHFSADMSEEMALTLVHEPPVGCIYDMAIHKPDIKLGMVAGNLCPRCVGQLKTLGTEEDAINAVMRIVSLVRAEASGRPVALDPQEVFIIMRFTANDENDNAWKHGIKPGVESCGLKPVRADAKVESGQLLEKIDRFIRRSRLIIAKVDENNLNVYYELGLAMGLDKDVLLISESSLVLNLPSDLKNWECLTYDKGNYDQLATKVRKFLCDNYSLTPLNSM